MYQALEMMCLFFVVEIDHFLFLGGLIPFSFGSLSLFFADDGTSPWKKGHQHSSTTGVSIIVTLCFYARNAAKESRM